MTWLLLGSGGQLGRALAAQDNVIALGRAEADLLQPGFVDTLRQRGLSGVINAAAYTAVDEAEGEGRTEAWRVNAEAVGELAAWCAKAGVPLVHFSTDYVFDGALTRPYREDDVANPLNVYGKSKRAGEEEIIRSGCAYAIFRTSWLYDAYGANFFTAMLRLFAQKESVSVVSDQIGAPTYAPHLAAAVIKALSRTEFPAGVTHLCSGGETSRHGFAQAIFALARSRDSGIRCNRVEAILSAAYDAPALRPENSRLDCAKAAVSLGISMPHWEEGLVACVDEYYGHRTLQDRGA